jgi:hypothetical protein
MHPWTVVGGQGGPPPERAAEALRRADDPPLSPLLRDRHRYTTTSGRSPSYSG